jgi:hypothetical protein
MRSAPGSIVVFVLVAIVACRETPTSPPPTSPPPPHEVIDATAPPPASVADGAPADAGAGVDAGAADAGAPPPRPRRRAMTAAERMGIYGRCARDADCVLVPGGGICRMCERDVRPRSVELAKTEAAECREWLKKHDRATLSCGDPAELDVERVESFRAACFEGACAKIDRAGPMPGGSDACQKDADCMLSTFPGCCESCSGGPYATSVANDRARRAQCARVDCAPPRLHEACPPVEDATGYGAICRASACVLVHP